MAGSSSAPPAPRPRRTSLPRSTRRMTVSNAIAAWGNVAGLARKSIDSSDLEVTAVRESFCPSARQANTEIDTLLLQCSLDSMGSNSCRETAVAKGVQLPSEFKFNHGQLKLLLSFVSK